MKNRKIRRFKCLIFLHYASVNLFLGRYKVVRVVFVFYALLTLCAETTVY